jgi:transcriptional regulator GlxA family with amidase domain
LSESLGTAGGDIVHWLASTALAKGFSLPNHLGRVFRSICGVTPGRYRRQPRG